MAKELEGWQEGDDLSAAKLDAMTDAINALRNIKIAPEGIAKVTYADANVSIEFKGEAFDEVIENGVLTSFLVVKRVGPA